MIWVLLSNPVSLLRGNMNLVVSYFGTEFWDHMHTTPHCNIIYRVQR